MGAQMRNIKLIGRLVSEIRGFEIGKKREFAQIYPGNRPIPWAADVRYAVTRKRCEIRGRHALTTNRKPGSADRMATSFPVRDVTECRNPLPVGHGTPLTRETCEMDDRHAF